MRALRCKRNVEQGCGLSTLRIKIKGADTIKASKAKVSKLITVIFFTKDDLVTYSITSVTMGKKKSQQAVEEKKAAAVADDNEEEDEVYEEDELELLQADLGDMVKLKQILDEAVAATILEKLDEDYRLDNIKLGIMMSACLFAVVAQFAPVPFPDSRPLLGVCCCSYFILSGVLQLITTFIDKDSILLTKPAANTKNKDLKASGVRVRSEFPRFSEWYTVILEYQGRENSPLVEQRWSVGNFFDKEGFFDEIGLQKEVESLYFRLEQGKYDSQTAPAEKKKQ
jgi:signal peptidase complex subunit 2